MFKGLVFGLILASAASAGSAKSSDYPMTARVYQIDRESDIVTIENASGFLFDFYGVEDWQEDDIVSCIMNDNGTETIYDDVIVSVRYGGRFSDFQDLDGVIEDF